MHDGMKKSHVSLTTRRFLYIQNSVRKAINAPGHFSNFIYHQGLFYKELLANNKNSYSWVLESRWIKQGLFWILISSKHLMVELESMFEYCLTTERYLKFLKSYHWRSNGALVSAQQCNSRHVKQFLHWQFWRVLDYLGRFSSISTKSTRLDMFGLFMGTHEKSCLRSKLLMMTELTGHIFDAVLQIRNNGAILCRATGLL